MKYTIGDKPVRIPVPGDKLIDEFIGKASTGHADLSVAHMVAPAGWTEPPQTPSFDEVTIVLSGRMHIMLDDLETIVLNAGQSIYLNKGVKVQYSNPFDEECEYWAICTPAFTVETAGRHD